MRSEWKVSGYPWSQWVISVVLVGLAATPTVISAVMEKPIHPVFILFACGMALIAAMALLATRSVRLIVDPA